jgi:hypothetical protein
VVAARGGDVATGGEMATGPNVLTIG